MILKEVSPYEPEVLRFIDLLNQHNLSFYPPEVCHLDPPEILAKENCIVIGAYNHLELWGMGAIKFFDDYSEIKRMFVPPKYRGKGVARLILNKLIEITKKKGLPKVRLETGSKFRPAVQLYKRNGFQVCGPFGPYKKGPKNMYMERQIN